MGDTTLTIPVGVGHIRLGDPQSAHQCPLALAMVDYGIRSPVVTRDDDAAAHKRWVASGYCSGCGREFGTILSPINQGHIETLYRGDTDMEPFDVHLIGCSCQPLTENDHVMSLDEYRRTIAERQETPREGVNPVVGGE